MGKLIAVILFIMSFSNMAATNKIQLFMAGDSTMSIKEIKDYPETGWGMPFSIFFNDNVEIKNRAKNGRSTRTFISEGLWVGIIRELNKGDYVIIQFGHNDQSKHKIDRYTSPEQYKHNLSNFIADVRAKQAFPLLMTPVTRRYFNDEGKIKDTHPIYADIVRDVARETGVDFIDMERVTQQHFQAMGELNSRLRFMHLDAGLHPNYPIGVKDDTHFNELGAREVAQLVLREMRNLQHPLVMQLRTPDPKHLK
ncbi:rhamnogalacturonan acetylesterase [Pseudoalteromonas haloplanktis]|uniref:Rhamnogalacturonan acetylesterase n=1 Tax=Pseudoalteromonas haloplanktis TaxID=228 RepID=A0ABU1B6V9_PSEHA|nr:rhamnogalacturonan acetylesterase [Pseudoalteromonas haloplanktis]MDQ9090100.1 rhamnogalacturonan acetylesterase [Pseudoalteromonas haloplanktis]